jgi:hypothetical protein
MSTYLMNFRNVTRHQSIRLYGLIGLLLMAIILFFANLGWAKPADLPKPVKACELITKAEAETFIGTSINNPDGSVKEYKSTKSWISNCNYDCPQKKTNVGVSLMPIGQKARGKEALSQYEQELREGFGADFKLVRIDDIGEAAGWDRDMKQLTTFCGQYRIIITIVSPALDAPASLQLSKKFAAMVVTRLKKM